MIALQEITPGILETIENYLKENAILETFVGVAPGCLKYLSSDRKKHCVEDICRKFKVTIEPKKAPVAGAYMYTYM